MRFHKKNSAYLLGITAPAILDTVSDVVKDVPELVQRRSNKTIDFIVHENKVRDVQVSDEKGSSRIRFFICNSVKSQMSLKDIKMRIDIPIDLLDNQHTDFQNRHVVYQVRFMLDRQLSKFDDATAAPFMHGYVGVTKRHFMVRWKEHHSDTVSGKGHLLHKSWRFLIVNQIPFAPVFQICSAGLSLDEAYDHEENAVGQYTLAPKGFNVIPGGRAGIKMLHELSMLSDKNSFPSAIERDAAVERAFAKRKASKSHIRCRHLREYAKEKFTWVRECWVNHDKHD